MEEKIREEIVRLYGDKGVQVGTMEKRFYGRYDRFREGGRKIDQPFTYDVEITFPGHETFKVSIRNVRERDQKIKDYVQEELFYKYFQTPGSLTSFL